MLLCNPAGIRLSLAFLGGFSPRLHRVGVLFAGLGRGSVPDEAFRLGLRKRGYIDGKNVVIEFQTAAGKYDDLPCLAAELVAMKASLPLPKPH